MRFSHPGGCHGSAGLDYIFISSGPGAPVIHYWIDMESYPLLRKPIAAEALSETCQSRLLSSRVIVLIGIGSLLGHLTFPPPRALPPTSGGLP